MEEEKEKNGRREENGRIHCIDDQDMALLPICKCSWLICFSIEGARKARDRDGFRIASSFSASGYVAGRYNFILSVPTMVVT